MADKELSHQESALLFIINLQNELAKTNSSGQDHSKMPPPQQIRRLQNSRGDPQSEHRSQA
jgi:hypothetical protein